MTDRVSASDEAQDSPSRLAVGSLAPKSAESEPFSPVPPGIQADYESAVRQRIELRRLD